MNLNTRDIVVVHTGFLGFFFILRVRVGFENRHSKSAHFGAFVFFGHDTSLVSSLLNIIEHKLLTFYQSFI